MSNYKYSLRIIDNKSQILMTIQNIIGFDINNALKIPHHFLSGLPEVMKTKYI